MPDSVRCEYLSEPQLPQRLRAGPLQLLPGVRPRGGRAVRTQGRPAVRGRAGVQTPGGEAALQRFLSVQVQLRGVRQRRQDVRQRVPAEGEQQEGAAAGPVRDQPDPEGTVRDQHRYDLRIGGGFKSGS